MNADDDDGIAKATSRLDISDGEEKVDHEGVSTHSAAAGLVMSFPTPSSSIVGDKRLWEITDKFRLLAAALPVGTLVKDETFTLFESVGALEIMDPKMDSGCLAPGEALVDFYDVERPLLPEEVLGIIDQFLCCEMAWHEGYPLAQTLFSSHYVDKLLSLEAKLMDQIHFSRAGRENPWSHPLLHIVLRAYAIALIKCCDYALEDINRTLDGGGTKCNFYEEEDYSGHTYGRELFTRIPVNSILDLLSTAVDFVENERAFSEKGERQSSSKVYEALRVRLDVRMLQLRAMSLEEDYDSKITLWQELPHHLKSIVDTHELARPLIESFSPKIQRRLASTSPPKPMVELSFDDAFSKYEQMCRDCQEAIKIVHYGPDQVQQLKAFLWSFSGRKPEPLAYPRSCLTAPLFALDTSGWEQLLRKDLETTVLPDDSVLDPINWTYEGPVTPIAKPNRRYEMAKTINLFTGFAAGMPGGYIDFFRALTCNRCRLRRTLVHCAVALEDLQTRETEQLDESLHRLRTDGLQFPLSTWTYHHKLRIMEWIVQLGFELDIYLPDELAGMYWYLSMLSSSRQSLVELIIPPIQQHLEHLMQQAEDISDEVARSVIYLRTLRLEAEATSALATALSSLFVSVTYLGLMRSTAGNSRFRDPKAQYELRMKPFLTIKSPDLPAFDEWEEATHPFGPQIEYNPVFEANLDEYLNDIEQQLKKARLAFTELKKLGADASACDGVDDYWSKNISALLQSCIAAGISLATVKSKPHPAELNLEIPGPGTRYHDWWIVPKLSRRAAGTS